MRDMYGKHDGHKAPHHGHESKGKELSSVDHLTPKETHSREVEHGGIEHRAKGGPKRGGIEHRATLPRGLKAGGIASRVPGRGKR